MVRVGIIGSGFGLYGLLPAFSSLKQCQITAVCANNQERIKKYCHTLEFTNIYSNWRVMFAKEKLDIVAIAVTPAAQYKIAKHAIQKGLHVFAEKPLTDTLGHAQTLYELAVKKGITHAIDFLFPEIDAWKKVKTILEKETYGKLIHISVNWDFLSFDIKNQIFSWKTDSSQGGGALSFYFCHALYYLEYFAGEIIDVKSNLHYLDRSAISGDVGADLLLRFKNNVLGSAHISCNTVGFNRHQLVFICEKATIILENKNSFVRNFSITIYTAGKNKSVMTKTVRQYDEANAKVQLVKKIASRFISGCIRREQVQPSFKEGLRVQRLIAMIKKKSQNEFED